MAVTKIATCCYCGTKAALVLRGNERHELACGNCGAPLKALKMLPTSAAPVETSPARPAKQSKRKPPKKREEKYVSRPKKRRKTKSFGKRMFAELWDVIEDVVDEVFD